MTETPNTRKSAENVYQAIVQTAEIVVNRSVIGGIFVVFMWGVYDIGHRMLDLDEMRNNTTRMLVDSLVDKLPIETCDNH